MCGGETVSVVFAVDDPTVSVGAQIKTLGVAGRHIDQLQTGAVKHEERSLDTVVWLAY